MKALSTVGTILYLIVIAPIYYYLFYKILQAVNASELMWFLFWVYVPVGIVCGLITRLVDKAEKEIEITEQVPRKSFKERLEEELKRNPPPQRPKRDEGNADR